MTAAEFRDRGWLPANWAESPRDHGVNRPGRSGIEAGAMNQGTRPAAGREHEPPLRGLSVDLFRVPVLETGDSRASSSTQ